jgi:hypothetical protein
MVVFCLVGSKCFGAGGEAAGVGAVAGVEEEVSAEFGALFEVFPFGGAVFPLADALRAVVNMGGFDVFVEGLGGGKGGGARSGV